MPQLALALLGLPQVRLGEQDISDTLPNKAQALLFYLAATKRIHAQDSLATLFWHDMPDQQARKNLRNSLPDLRRSLDEYVVITRHTVAFNTQQSYWLDIDFFCSTLEQDQQALTLEILRKAIDLYRGDFLANFYVHASPAFEEWVLSQQAYLRELVMHSLDRLIKRYLEAEQYAQGLAATKQILAIEPWRETAHRQQMILLAHLGWRNAALTQYETCRAMLKDAFGLQPMPETTAIYEQIKAKRLEPWPEWPPQV